MSTTNSTAEEPQITDRRIMLLDHAGRWTVCEFDTGHVILSVNALRASVDFHFDAEQWTEFQRFVLSSGDQS